VTVDSAGDVYVADQLAIRKITPAGEVTTLAGGYGYVDGTGSDARFNFLAGVTVDNAGNLYLPESGAETIRKVMPVGPDWVVTTLAGMVFDHYGGDGTGSAAHFFEPFGVAVDSAGNVYVAERSNQTIRQVTPAGVVTTLAGNNTIYNGGEQLGGDTDGTGISARFNNPRGVAVDSGGNLYVADTGNNTIRKGTPALLIDTSAGSLTVSNGSFLMRLTGPVGSNVVVEASANLVAWTPVQTNALPLGGLNLAVPVSTNPQRFFRARLAP
jgi:hypothetical protein